MKKSIKPILIKIVQIEKLVSALKTDYEKSFDELLVDETNKTLSNTLKVLLGELSDELQSYLKNNQ